MVFLASYLTLTGPLVKIGHQIFLEFLGGILDEIADFQNPNSPLDSLFFSLALTLLHNRPQGLARVPKIFLALCLFLLHKTDHQALIPSCS